MAVESRVAAGLTLLGRAVHGQTDTELEVFPAPPEVSLVTFATEVLRRLVRLQDGCR